MTSVIDDVSVGELLLQSVGTKYSREVSARVVDGQIERSMTAAPSLSFTVTDYDRTLISSGIFDNRVDLLYDGVWWRLTQVSKAADNLTLLFEDRTVSYLRAVSWPVHMSRDQITRAEFALALVHQCGEPPGSIPFYCPELHTKQPIADTAGATAAADGGAAAQTASGLDDTSQYHVTHADGGRTIATKTQIALANRVMAVAASVGASVKATLALLEAVQIESGLANLPGGDRDSRGILQVRDATARGLKIDNMDVEACCNAFLKRGFWGKGGAITLAAENPDKTPGWVAQQTQGSAYPDRYDLAERDARAFLAGYTGNAAIAVMPAKVQGQTALDAADLLPISGGTAGANGPYLFERGSQDGKTETTWDCLRRLAQDVNWAFYVVDGAVWFTAENTLNKRKPLWTASEDDPDVLGVDFDVDNNKVNSLATVTVRATRRSFPPGSVVVLRHLGPANGRWLIGDVSRSLFDPTATLNLHRYVQPLKEPAAGSGAATTDSTDINAIITQLAGDTSLGDAQTQAQSGSKLVTARTDWKKAVRSYPTRVKGPTPGLIALMKYISDNKGNPGDPGIDYKGHEQPSYHYMGMATDIGDGSGLNDYDGKDNPKAIVHTWTLLMPIVAVLDELFWWHLGFWKYGDKIDDAFSNKVVSNHHKHIHVAYSGTPEQLFAAIRQAGLKV